MLVLYIPPLLLQPKFDPQAFQSPALQLVFGLLASGDQDQAWTMAVMAASHAPQLTSNVGVVGVALRRTLHRIGHWAALWTNTPL